MSADVVLDTSPLESGHKGRGVGTYTRMLKKTLEESDTDLLISYSSDAKNYASRLVHYPYFDLFFHTLPIKHQQKVVVTIHDLIPLKFPDHFKPGVKGSLRFYLQKLALKNVDHIITDSYASQKDICNLLGVKEEKVSVVHLAASSSFVPKTNKEITPFKEKYSLPKKFFGYVGDINYNKNLPRLIHCIAEVKGANLVIVTRADLTTDIPEAVAIQQAISESGIGNRFRHLTLDSSDELALFYSACEWYIQPSLAEGFGLPVLEAMQSGTPVIIASGSSLDEIVYKEAVRFNPTNQREITNTLMSVLKLDNAEHDRLSKKALAHASSFSWQKTTQETVNVYTKVLGKS